MENTALDDRIAHSTLVLLGKHGWDKLTPALLATHAKISKTAAQGFLATPCPMLRALTAAITRQSLHNYRHDTHASPRDALFDLLMLRFDVLQKYRAGIVALMAAARHNPKYGIALTSAMPAQMLATLNAAHITPATVAHQLGFASIYAATLWVWQRDDTADLARTMAALDGHLRRTEKLLLKFQPQNS